MRTAAVSGTGDQLRQHAVHCVGMDERHLKTVQTETRLAVDELHALAVEPGELRAQVVDLVGDVVHARTAASKEPPDRRVVVQRREQLHPAGADVQRDGLGTLRRDRLARLHRRAEQPLVRGNGLVEVA